MSEVYRLYTEADYDATTKTTGTGVAQAWDVSTPLSGLPGSVKFTLNGTNSVVYCSKSFPAVSTAFCSYRIHLDAGSLSLPVNTNFAFLFRLASGVTRPGNSRLMIRNSSGTIQLFHYIYDDNDASPGNATWNISEPINYIEVKIYKSSTDATADGRQELWVNGVLRHTIGSRILFDYFAYDRFDMGPWSVGVPNGTLNMGGLLITNDDLLIGPYGPSKITTADTNILDIEAGTTIVGWTAKNGGSKTSSAITFPQQTSGDTPASVEFTFAVNRFTHNLAHRFTGFMKATTLNYGHTSVKWFVRNERTGIMKFNQMTFGNHSDKGGHSSLNELKEFNMVFYTNDDLDQYTVGFMNLNDGQPGLTFEVSDLAVYLVL